ncbi:MAG TPA: phosphatase [Actinomycetota bacterium]|nr:phosphatase [Actinomycetota bacterium]
MTPDQRRRLREHLVASGIAGDTRTARDNCVANATKLANGDPDKALGIGARGKSADEVMQAVADLCGCSPDCSIIDGPGVIDPDRVLDALHALGDRLEKAAADGARMIAATGHPTGLMPLYQRIGRALRAEGVEILTPLDAVTLEPPRKFRRRRSVLYLDRVAALNAGADLVHTHESWPMDAVLDAAGAVDLVLADHGWAGAAIARGIETVCFTDVNDPAIAVAKADGLVEVVVPCDDNLPPVNYEPVGDYLTGRIARTG